MKQLTLIACLVAIIFSHSSHARPVSYPGGWTIMQFNNQENNSVHLHYSPTAKYSVGYHASHFRKDELQFHTMQFNYLAKRWNKPGTQANIYLKSGLGIAHSNSAESKNETAFAAFAGLSADWESRRHFVSYENKTHYADAIDTFFMQNARIGVAPYVGDYGDLHTWLMLQLEHDPTNDDQFTITPLVRLFKGVSLVEAGVTHRGDALFNWVVRF